LIRVLDFQLCIPSLLQAKPQQWRLYLFILHVDFFALIVAAVMKWDAAATETQIKSAAADHLKHAPGRLGGGGY